MSETLRITCPCGYENWVPVEKLGQTVACFVCGADLQVDEGAESGHRELPGAAEQFEDTTALESPFAPPARPARRDPATTYEEAEEKARRAPRSPFEADDLDTAVRPKFQHPPPTSAPSAAPAARPRSPFEPDAPPEDEAFRQGKAEKYVADPFTRELVPAPKPAPSMSDEMEKHRPTERRSRNVFIDTISPHDAPTGEKCDQCGRPIRGSWDRHETQLGVLCYICTNQATHDIPDRVKAGSGMRTELRESELLVDPVDIRNAAPVQPDYGVTQTPGFKKLILWMAWGVIALAVFAWITGWGGSTTPETVLSLDGSEAPRVPDFIRYIVWAVRLAGAFVAAVAAIYLTLDRKSDLPHERLLLNVLNIGALVTLVGVAQFGISFVNYFFIDDPVIGIVFYTIAGVLLFLLFVYLLIGWFDFDMLDFLWLFLFYMPMVQLIIGLIGYFFQWGLYEWVV